jgi:putative FmdB family regulatory protein
VAERHKSLAARRIILGFPFQIKGLAMPIYAYRCSACGHAKDVLQKMSDPVLSVCPVCGESTFVKQVTAAGFQLKGSGWYVTDFRGDKKAAAPAAEGTGEGASADAGKAAAGTPAAAPAAGGGESSGSKPADSKAAAPKKGDAAPSPAPAPAAPPPASPSGGSK